MVDFKIEAGVFVNGHVAKTDHSLHALSRVGRKNLGRLKQQKCIATVLWYTELPLAYPIHGKINGRFTGSLQIEDDGILFSLIGNMILFLSCVFLLNALSGRTAPRSDEPNRYKAMKLGTALLMYAVNDVSLIAGGRILIVPGYWAAGSCQSKRQDRPCEDCQWQDASSCGIVTTSQVRTAL